MCAARCRNHDEERADSVCEGGVHAGSHAKRPRVWQGLLDRDSSRYVTCVTVIEFTPSAITDSDISVTPAGWEGWGPVTARRVIPHVSGVARARGHAEVCFPYIFISIEKEGNGINFTRWSKSSLV